jgi:hypothetical protein
MNPEFINGPTNYVRLEGDTNGIKKEIHIFFEKHHVLEDRELLEDYTYNAKALDYQTRCDSFDSVDIAYYLYTLIKESKEKLDFFMEIGTEQLNVKSELNKKTIYLKEVTNLFKSLLKIKDEHVEYSILNNNVRLHYFDIRYYFNIHHINNILYDTLWNDIESLDVKNKNNAERIDEIKSNFDEIKSNFDEINSNIEQFNKNVKEVRMDGNKSLDKVNEKQKYYLNKITNGYSNKSLKKKICVFLDIQTNNIMTHIHNLNINNERILYKEMPTNRDTMHELKEKLKTNIRLIEKYIIQLHSLWTDSYLLRRILDKNYIGKCIIYSGGKNCVNMIFFMVKYCNFTIKKVQKSPEQNIRKIITKINNEVFPQNVYELFLSDHFDQCIRKEHIGGYNYSFLDILPVDIIIKKTKKNKKIKKI